MKNHKFLFILAFLAIGLWSCEEEEFDFLQNATPVSAEARVKFYHGIPGGPAVDFLWQGKRLNGGRVTVANSAFLPVTYGNFFPTFTTVFADKWQNAFACSGTSRYSHFVDGVET